MARECFFWYQLTRVVPDKGPLNGGVCMCIIAYGLIVYDCLLDLQSRRVKIDTYRDRLYVYQQYMLL